MTLNEGYVTKQKPVIQTFSTLLFSNRIMKNKGSIDLTKKSKVFYSLHGPTKAQKSLKVTNKFTLR